jgi:hypothetical protein
MRTQSKINCLDTVGRLCDDAEIRGRVDKDPEASAHEGLVISDQDADHETTAGRGRVARTP